MGRLLPCPVRLRVATNTKLYWALQANSGRRPTWLFGLTLHFLRLRPLVRRKTAHRHTLLQPHRPRVGQRHPLLAALGVDVRDVEIRQR
jgi:hypothetical protein